jgi:hypothetical protein
MVRAVRAFSRRSPRSRPYLLVGAVATLIGVAIGIPRLDRIAPHMRESPAALVPILGAAVGLALAALCAVAAIIGVILSRRPGAA